MPTSHSVTTPDLPRVATLLQRHNVECVLVGGMLARLYGSKEMTSDVDAVAHWTRSNLEALCRALDESGAAVRVRADPSGDEGNDDYRRPPGGFKAGGGSTTRPAGGGGVDRRRRGAGTEASTEGPTRTRLRSSHDKATQSSST